MKEGSSGNDEKDAMVSHSGFRYQPSDDETACFGMPGPCGRWAADFP
jgi:hypothetical protein